MGMTGRGDILAQALWVVVTTPVSTHGTIVAGILAMTTQRGDDPKQLETPVEVVASPTNEGNAG